MIDTGPRPAAPSLPAGQRPSPFQPAVAGATLLVTGLTMGLYATVVGPVSTGEMGVALAISRHRTAALDVSSRIVEAVTGPFVAPLLVLLLAAVVWARDSRSRALRLVVLTAAGWSSTAVGRLAVQRVRPPAGTIHAMFVENHPDSFPSGHVAFAAALVAAFVVTRRAAGRSVWPVLAPGAPLVAAVGYLRLYAGIHFLVDVLAAPLMASGAVLLAVAAARQRPRLEPAASSSSRPAYRRWPGTSREEGGPGGAVPVAPGRGETAGAPRGARRRRGRRTVRRMDDIVGVSPRRQSRDRDRIGRGAAGARPPSS